MGIIESRAVIAGAAPPLPCTRVSARRRSALPPWLRIVRERPTNYGADGPADRTPVRSPRELVALLSGRMESEEVEIFVAVLLDAQHRVIALTEVSRGIVTSTLVHPREVFRTAIALGASAIVLAHNHPSGDPTPSADDRSCTAQLVAAGKVLDIPVHDHVIFGAGRYTSFAEAGLL
jgi:DNA repair protein RadC